ncbi:phosphate signaling complex protein PhoU [Amedibacterium intestinale]|uniref:Phosphate-specific transport system accessory protein PhoU n=1 Tax=Amedibacterium intestinale TaxID=2583452 RepID=A0A6N4TJS1_9FIRM|nr:phosphate signaling complex protein PhoU [Amedibacterium intestinale]RHO19065.1 phosphate transport system regulatory protein PhoU [Eubacterium sp. AM18-26]RHO22585.1 phosphate transport system regulatory protein PhoU [Eubacterium sp. AM18-10LB-B]RHO30130.1 phosphate transport system regulatory protein PhoU [Erysipelotrichaceae bacterium AM17-60]BBK22967.1 phosphate transport system regulatory protein PhoU [Amedibacterium intestinale]BBK62738.1 phosphate transport system regulatory protein 
MVKIDKELDTMEANVMKMARQVISMHEKVVEVLENPDREMELEIMQADDIINHMEEEVNDQAVRSLALLSPVASDLRKVVADIKIASELERIGDYAKNVAKYLLKQDAQFPHVLEYAQQMEKYMINMLQETMKAYEERNVESAFEIVKRDQYLNQLVKEIRARLKEESGENLIEDVFVVSGMLRNIERAGDHIKNICEHIIYMMKGQHYDFG